ncbi:hypothetical protein EVAR_41866_1 [Eumeta japonica]|uniref:Uncharacterized protein n=1 Tax=Eumeta variegata TaxID=151549 RepID=A0A4C1XDC4_EUMVA|nr:hypothetical protein EVAR_41866_1 [Eumeta japonica]
MNCRYKSAFKRLRYVGFCHDGCRPPKIRNLRGLCSDVLYYVNVKALCVQKQVGPLCTEASCSDAYSSLFARLLFVYKPTQWRRYTTRGRRRHQARGRRRSPTSPTPSAATEPTKRRRRTGGAMLTSLPSFCNQQGYPERILAVSSNHRRHRPRALFMNDVASNTHDAWTKILTNV